MIVPCSRGCLGLLRHPTQAARRWRKAFSARAKLPYANTTAKPPIAAATVYPARARLPWPSAPPKALRQRWWRGLWKCGCAEFGSVWGFSVCALCCRHSRRDWYDTRRKEPCANAVDLRFALVYTYSSDDKKVVRRGATRSDDFFVV